MKRQGQQKRILHQPVCVCFGVLRQNCFFLGVAFTLYATGRNKLLVAQGGELGCYSLLVCCIKSTPLGCLAASVFNLKLLFDPAVL